LAKKIFIQNIFATMTLSGLRTCNLTISGLKCFAISFLLKHGN